jgi:hypothetical protein
MSELMKKIADARLAERERLVALPIEQKLIILEKLRERSFSIKNPAVATAPGSVYAKKP